MLDRLRYLLLQMRNGDDPMRAHEVRCFARVLGVDEQRVAVYDLLGAELRESDLAERDVVLLGGSGDYSAVTGGEWLERVMAGLRRVHGSGKPTFCSCWGFQAMARAMGGEVVHDRSRAEIGTFEVVLTPEGRQDAVFSVLGERALVQMGHEDRVDRLPDGAVLLASSERVRNQAYRFDDAPVYCTQFHPELAAEDLLLRFKNYPHYLEVVAGLTADELEMSLRESRESEELVRAFVREMVGAG